VVEVIGGRAGRIVLHLDVESPRGPAFRAMGWSRGGVVLSCWTCLSYGSRRHAAYAHTCRSEIEANRVRSRLRWKWRITVRPTKQRTRTS